MENKQKFGPLLTVIFTLNYIVGAGFLSLGRAFYDSGIVLGVICISFITFCTAIAKDMYLVVMARADNVQKMEIQSTVVVPLSPSATTTNENAIEMESFQQDSSDQEPFSLLENDAEGEGQQTLYDGVEPLECLHVGEREIEISTICGMYYGPYAEGIAVTIISLSMFGSLCIYSTLFAHSLSERVGGKLDSNLSYLLWLGVFAFIVVPLSCKNLEEQVFFQVTLAWCRLFVMALMIVVVYSGGTYGNGFVEADVEKPPLVNWSGLGNVLTSLMYAFNFHVAMPVLSHPVDNKRNLGHIFNISICICATAYVSLAVTMAQTFGDRIEESCNMNYSAWVPPEPLPHWFGNVTSTIILIFPAIDVVSAYPLISIALGENLRGVIGRCLSLDRSHGGVILTFRLVASTLPILGAAVFRDFESVVDITGLTAFIMIFVIPAALLWKSSKLHPCHPTVHDTILTKTRGIDTALGIIGNVLLFLAILDLARE